MLDGSVPVNALLLTSTELQVTRRVPMSTTGEIARNEESNQHRMYEGNGYTGAAP